MYLIVGPATTATTSATPPGLRTPGPSARSSRSSELPSSPPSFLGYHPSAVPTVGDTVFGDTAEAFRDPGLTAERYSLLHLDLLHHLNTEFLQATHDMQPQISVVLRLAYKEALRAPYVMDEILALTAAHKSTVVGPDRREIYLMESTKLQTRAVAQVHPQSTMVTEENGIALFCFSAFLGQHTLFDVFSNTFTSATDSLDLSLTLDRLCQCLHLHSGIGAIARPAWAKLRLDTFDEGGDSEEIRNFYKPTYEIPDVADSVGKHCLSLARHLEEGSLDDKAKEVYRTSVRILQHLHDSICAVWARRASALHHWLARMPNEYNTYLRQRQPEALVILAHFGILLHYAKDYWAVGDSGALLIRAISNHLGDYWSEWLEWPNKVIDAT